MTVTSYCNILLLSLHGVSNAEPCYKCKDHTDLGCLRCFKPFGERGQTQTEKQNFFALKDNHDCLMTALENLAAQDTPLGRATATHLATYVPLVPIPAEDTNLMRNNPRL